MIAIKCQIISFCVINKREIFPCNFNGLHTNFRQYTVKSTVSKWISENCCHGFYFAVKRILSESESLCKYNIIGQTFNYNQITDDESAYFAIRENMNDELLYNIAVSKSEPVLPTFGCVDIMNILLDIDNIKTAEQTIQIAVK